MKRLVVGIVAATVLVSMVRTAAAQSKTVTSEMKVQTGTVEAIDPAQRMVTLKKSDGTFVTVVAGPDITRFSEVKAGDTVTVRYYENLVVRLKRSRRVGSGLEDKEHDTVLSRASGRYQSHPANDHGHDHGHRPGYAVDHVHRAEWLDLHVKGAGPHGSRQGEGRRQGRHRVDRSDAGGARPLNPIE